MESVSLKMQNVESTVYIGTDVMENRLPKLLVGQTNFVITDSKVFSLYGNFFKKYFQGVEIFVLAEGEENKNFQSLYAILEKMAGAGMRRTSKLFAVGGGVVGDIGGLAASLYMRGISCVQIPTTLLAQVDSSVGGKTAVDLGGVKNVVGTFYQPQEVLIDPTFLKTLPRREIKCGLGEIVKYAALNGKIFDLLLDKESEWENISFLQSLIKACVSHKARVVETDEKETGERKSLNVGHTTGHAIELSHGLSHGESVLYGMLFETEIAMENGICERRYGEQLLKIVRHALALTPLSNPDFSKIAKNAEKAKSDKKNTDDEIVLSVAKKKGEWALLSLPFKRYTSALEKAVRNL